MLRMTARKEGRERKSERLKTSERAAAFGFDFMDRLSKQEAAKEREVLNIRSNYICGRARQAVDIADVARDGPELAEKVEALRSLLSQLPTGYLHPRSRSPRKRQ